MLFWLELWSGECRFLSLGLSTLCYPLMNSIVPLTNQVLQLLEQLTLLTWVSKKLLQSPCFFSPFTPTLITPLPPPIGILYSPQFCSHQETKMTAHWTQWLTSMISLKIGDCEQSSFYGIASSSLCPTYSAVPENIQSYSPWRRDWNFLEGRGGGSIRPKNLKKCIKLKMILQYCIVHPYYA